MKSVFFLFTILTLGSLLLVSCKHDAGILPDNPTITDNCSPDTVYFQNEILPLLVSNCATSGCHNAGSASEGVVLIDYASIVNTAEVRPGHPNNSKLYEVLVKSNPDKRMPPSPKQPLTSEQIAKISKWISQGANDNACNSDNCDTVNVSYANHISPIVQNTCLGCHSGGQPLGGISLSTFNDVVQQAINGRLLGSIQRQNGFVPMPENGYKLSDCKITQFKKWIENGTPNN